MAGAETLANILLFRKGQEAAGRDYLAILDNHGPVVQGAVKLKYRHNQARGNLGVNACTGFNHVPDIDPAGEHHEHSAPLLGKQFRGGYYRFKLTDTGFGIRPEELGLSQPHNDFAQLRLEHYGNGDKQPRPHNGKHPEQGI